MATTADVLWEHVQRDDLCPGAESFEAWLDVRWIKARIGGRAVPVLPVIGYRNSLTLHDVHHVLTGYDTNWRGELEIAAWELGSGGCARYYLYWIDRFIFVAIGMLLIPRAVLGAYRRGREHRNLYARTPEDVLDSDLEETLRATVGVRGR